MHDTEAGRGYTAQRQGSTDTDCPHACLERVGRVRDGFAVVDLDCVDCPATVHEDVRGRTVDRGDGVATDGGEVQVLTPDDTLALTDEGIELPEMLRGYSGTFEIRTPNVDGTYNTTDTGMPDAEFYDGPIAVYPDDGDYNPELEAGMIAVSTSGHPELVYEIDDQRTEEVDRDD